MASFQQKLQLKFDEGKFICLGLDPDLRKFPKSLLSGAPSGRLIRFCVDMVDETYDLVCAYKLNAAFFEQYGIAGQQALTQIIRHIRRVAPDVVIILDYKRGDIDNTNNGYIERVLKTSQYFHGEDLDVDAVTVNPYMGGDSLKPFLELKDKGIIVLCRTSNPGAREFQERRGPMTRQMIKKLGLTGSARRRHVPLYEQVAFNFATKWNKHSNCCLVVGATAPKQLARVRKLVGDMPILLPGIGTQGGEVESAVAAGKNSRDQGMIINLSRSALYASSGPDYAPAGRAALQEAHDRVTAQLAA